MRTSHSRPTEPLLPDVAMPDVAMPEVAMPDVVMRDFMELDGPPEDGDLLLQRTLRQVRAEFRRRGRSSGPAARSGRGT